MAFSTILFLFLVSMFASFSSFGPACAQQRTWTVDVRGQADFDSIQEAIDNAVDGDTIFVNAGTYYEHVVVNKTLSLVGENSNTTIIDGNWTGVVINVTRNGVIISDLTVQRSGSTYWENAGIFLDNVENCSISESILTENSFAGLELNHSHRCNISGNSILNNGGVGVTVVGGSFNDLSRNNIVENGWSALTLNDEADNNTISENSMTSNNLAVIGHCINLYRSRNNTIQKNNITDDDNGIRLEYWSNCNVVSRNNITSNTLTGVSVEKYSDNNTISNNVVGGSRFGVAVDGSRYVEICNNTIAHNYGGDMWDAGIRLDSAGYSRIYSNLIMDNWRGILLYTSSPNVSIYSNTITDNEYAIRVSGGGSNYLTVSDNIVMNNRGYGIGLTGFGSASNYATISRNLIVNNSDGIALGQYSNYNTISQNNISMNDYGFYIEFSTQNAIYSNNVWNNAQQAHVASGSVNKWDADYSSGGNYWSDQNFVDEYSGPNQDIPGSDDVCDGPYVIDEENQDRYPLMEPWISAILRTDLNDDGAVNILDISIVARAFGSKAGDPSWNELADLDKNSVVNIIDISMVAKDFGKTA